MLAVLCVIVMTGCVLPPLEPRFNSARLPLEEIRDTSLYQFVQELRPADPSMALVYPLMNSQDAFAVRMLLAKQAQRSLDVQYYIWRADTTGLMLLRELHEAAQRGVRVRLLLDDNGVSGMDPLLAALNQHPNAEVRLFNPFVYRKFKRLGYLTHFRMANRRMHNKAFTVDGAFSVTGGRNIGDEYFGAADGVMFADLDVLLGGGVVQEISADFDRYWRSESAYPLERIVPRAPERSFAELLLASSAYNPRQQVQYFTEVLEESPFVQKLFADELEVLWANVRLLSDDPAKGLNKDEKGKSLLDRVTAMTGMPQERWDIISPYFVPTRSGTKMLQEVADAGVDIRILTNSLDATDVAAVHSGYGKYRKPLLEHGIELYEMRRLMDEGVPRPILGPFGSSGASLHAKTFSIDDDILFIGSFNFDPRSAHLNTEMGVVIHHPELTEQAHDVFEKLTADHAYIVTLNEKNRLRWLRIVEGERVVYTREPQTSWYKRAAVKFMEWLPIEWML